jgi:sulfur relay (sulfurtransferase) complex TusBCD TusD component (DsrE family)
MARTLFILTDAPYGTERSYNALRLAGSLARRPGEDVKVFLMGDAAGCAKANQKVPQGHYNVELMLQARQRAMVSRSGSAVPAWMHAAWPMASSPKERSGERSAS